MFGEPPRTQYDLRFTLLNLPVRVHPLFWVVGAILGMHSEIGNMRIWMLLLLSWVCALFVSILVHELGHALPLSRIFGARTWIVLYGMGGLALHDPYYRKRTPTTLGTIAYTAAGPLAGFALAALVVVVMLLCRVNVAYDYISFGNLLYIPFVGIETESFVRQFAFLPRYVMLFFYQTISNILYISTFWGLMNLLPLYPLDGGQISREIFLSLDRRNGIANSLWLSVFTGGVISALAFMQWVHAEKMDGIPFIAILFGLLAFQSYQALMSSRF